MFTWDHLVVAEMLTAMNQAHYSIRQPVAVPHTPLYFVLMLHPLAQHLKGSYSTKLKKEIFFLPIVMDAT